MEQNCLNLSRLTCISSLPCGLVFPSESEVALLCLTLRPHGLCSPWDSPDYWSGKTFPSPGVLPNPGIEPRSPTLWADSLRAEPQGKPKSTGVGSLSVLQWIPLTQGLNQGVLHCRWILYQLSLREAQRENTWKSISTDLYLVSRTLTLD